MQKDTEPIDIPESAFNEVLIGKLPGQIRKRVVRKAIKMHEAVEQFMAQVKKEHPGLGSRNPKPKKRTLRDTLPWGRFLKMVLEEEKYQK